MYMYHEAKRVAVLFIVLGLASPAVAQMMYWTSDSGQSIHRASIDGGQIEDLVTGEPDPVGLALDIFAGKMYWSDEGLGTISRANLDGTCIETVVTGLTWPQGLSIDAPAGKIYWVDDGTDKIQRANLDGSGVEDLVSSGIDVPWGIALGPSPAPPEKGDLDGDGVIGLKDVVLLFRVVIRGLPLTPEQEAQGAIDCDGDVDLTDVLILAEYAIGIRPALPC